MGNGPCEWFPVGSPAGIPRRVLKALQALLHRVHAALVAALLVCLARSLGFLLGQWKATFLQDLEILMADVVFTWGYGMHWGNSVLLPCQGQVCHIHVHPAMFRTLLRSIRWTPVSLNSMHSCIHVYVYIYMNVCVCVCTYQFTLTNKNIHTTSLPY